MVIPRGESGEICVKGPTLMLGYIGTPLDETLDAEGFFRTGDGGYLDAGRSTLLGGQAHGYHQDGRCECLTARSRRGTGEALSCEGDTDRWSCRIARSERSSSPASCRTTARPSKPKRFADILRERLASYKVPRHVLFLHEDDIALTGSDKIKSGELRELAAQRLSESADRHTSGA